MKILVLCGGISSERSVSLNTSLNVAKALRKNGHDVLLVDSFFGPEGVEGFSDNQDFEKAALYYGSLTETLTDSLIAGKPFFGDGVFGLCKEADIVFIGLHGACGEDGKVQAAFDLSHIKYTGSGFMGSAAAMDKSRAKKLLKDRIRMPEGIVISKDNPFRKRIPAPCVIKPNNGGSSVGVEFVNSDNEYEDAVKRSLKYDDTLLAEQFIDGRELTQGVLGNETLPPVEILPPDEGKYDYENKYNGLTKEICPADIPENTLSLMSEYSLLAGKILGLSVYYRIDYLLDKKTDRLYMLEANSLPGMTATSLIPLEALNYGLTYEQLCEKIIEMSLDKYR